MRQRKQQLSGLTVSDPELRVAVGRFDSALRETDSIIRDVHEGDLRFSVAAIESSNRPYVNWSEGRLYIYNESEGAWYYVALSS